MECLGAMATWNRQEITIPCIESYLETCEPDLMSLTIVDNGSSDGLAEWLLENKSRFENFNVKVFYNRSNVGTATAINSVWSTRLPSQHCLKIDSDVLWLQSGWLSKMIEAFTYSTNIGLVGLRRKDIWEHPDHEDPFYRTKIMTFENDEGKTIRIEQSQHVIGTCWLVRNTLVNTIGALVQPTLYGFDDSLYCLRAAIAGFASVFILDVDIEHNDPGETYEVNAIYTKWKQSQAGSDMEEYEKLRDAYLRGETNVYENFQTELSPKEDFRYTQFTSKDSEREIFDEFGKDLSYKRD